MADNNNRGGFQAPPRKKNALDNRKLNLSAPSPGTPGKKSNLVWGLYEGNPRLTVYVGDAEGSKISAALDAPVFFAFLELLKMADKAEPDWKAKIENKNFTWFGGKRSETPQIVSELWVGKDKEGQIWISVIDTKSPKVRFFICNPEFHTLIHGDGTEFTKGEVSSIFTRGYVELLTNIVSILFVHSWPEVEAANKKRAEAAEAKRNGGGGGYNHNKGSSSGGNNQSTPAAEPEESDFPF